MHTNIVRLPSRLVAVEYTNCFSAEGTSGGVMVSMLD